MGQSSSRNTCQMRTLENLATLPQGPTIIERRTLHKNGLLTRDAMLAFERRVFNTAKPAM